MQHFWQRYYTAIRNRIFIPWLLYFFCVIVYVTLFTVEGYDQLSSGQKSTEVIMRFIILALMLYLILFEIICIIRDGWKYLYDFYNYIDVASFAINIYLILATVWLESSGAHRG